MWGRLSSADRGRYSALAALGACAVLALIALWLLARLVWLLVPRADDALALPAARPGNTGTAVLPALSIAKWHLFGNTPLPRAGSGGVPATTLSLILRGTLADRDPRSGIAMIGDGLGSERAYRVGDEVAGGAKLQAIYPDHVVLLHEGVEETLKLPRDTMAAPGDIVQPTPGMSSSRAPARGANVPSDSAAAASFAPAPAGGSGTAWQQTVQQIRQNPESLASHVQVVPVMRDGKLAGVRLASTTDAALLGRIGIRPTDVVTAVNGVPVDSLRRGAEIAETLKSATSARVTVLRDGRPTEITIRLH